MRNIAFALIFAAAPAAADCFDETLLVSRYHYPNPGTVNENFQDVYLLDFPPLPQTIPTVTRLSSGFNAAARYDSTDAVFSPDGSRIVFISNRDNAFTDLYVMDSADANGDGQGDNLVRVTNDAFERYGLHWGSGNRLVYVTEQPDYQTATATLDPGGSLATESVLTAHVGETAPPTLSADGAHIIAVFEETSSPNRTHSLNHVTSSGGLVTRLIYDGVVNWSPSLSPDGETLYFASTRASGRFDIFKAEIDLSATPPTMGPLTNITQTSNLSESDVKVSPDGACLAYLASDLTSTYGPNSDLYVTDLAAQATRRVTSTRDIGSFDWAPTGFTAVVAQAEPAAEQVEAAPKAVHCNPFDAADIEALPINGVRAYVHTATAAPATTRFGLCTAEFPAFTDCALTRVEGAGAGRSCEVRPTRGLVNAGRWSLFLENASGANDLTCAMTCFSR